MAKFGEASHHVHMHNGIKAALASAKTPAHLKPHLQARVDKPVLPPKVKSVMPVRKAAPKMAASKRDPFFGEM